MSNNSDPQSISTTVEESPSMTGSLNAEGVSAFVVELAKIKAITAEAQTKLAEINGVAAQVLAAKTKVVDDQAVIATKSDHIDGAQKHADKVRGDLDRLLTAATLQAADVEGQKTRAQSAADSTAEILATVRTTRATADADAEAIVAVRKTAEESAAIAKGLADKSATIEARIEDYETQLGALKTQCTNQLKTIESLLPGAASAGLAHSFDKRRQTFLRPQNLWQFAFVGSLLTLGAVAIPGLVHVYQLDVIPTLDELGRLWLVRLPVVVTLIWLAVYASREAAQAKRLEEDYGFKAATAACFEGFRTQMSEVGKNIAPESPVAILCADTLKTIASPPGRIYEKHKLTVTPAGELVETVKSALEAIKLRGPQS